MKSAADKIGSLGRHGSKRNAKRQLEATQQFAAAPTLGLGSQRTRANRHFRGR
jgi:hypothetical protein